MNRQLLIEEPQQAPTRQYPKLNPSKASNYFIQITRAIKKNWRTCTRSYGLFIEGDPNVILAYLNVCYTAYNEVFKDNERYFHYFINTDPNMPGLIYYGQKADLKELKQGDCVGYTFRATAIVGHMNR